MRIIVWNCHGAGSASEAWDYLLELDPEIALLQEVRSLPAKIESRYDWRGHLATNKDGTSQRFQTGILARRFGERIELRGPESWVNKELERFAGNLVAYEVLTSHGKAVNVISVYSPAWPVSRERLDGVDTSHVKLTQNCDVWVGDLLWASLVASEINKEQNWIVGGDFNLSESFDLWCGGPRGNREYLDRMSEVGLVECLRTSTGILTPTFRNLRDGMMKHQMDHLFVTQEFGALLSTCCTGSQERVFGLGLSDHLPIIADFGE